MDWPNPECREISLKVATTSAAISVVLTDARQAAQPIVYVNQAFTTLTGYSSEEILGQNCRFLQGPGTDPTSVEAIRQALAEGVSVQCELLNYRKTGEQYWNFITIDPVHDEAGEITHFISFQHDGTSERTAIAARADTEKHLEHLTSNLPGFIFRRVMHADTSTTYPYLSRSLFRILGLPDDTHWSGGELIDHVHPDDRAGFLQSVLESGLTLTPLTTEVRILASSGCEHWFRSHSAPRAADDGTIIWEGLAVEVTAEKASESKLAYLAHHDYLTGLPNRVLFRTALREAFASRSPASDLALFYIDLDDFQVLNEEVSQTCGDLVLQEVGRRLFSFAKHRGGTVARLGGDEFAMLLTSPRYGLDPLAVSEAILADLQRVAILAEYEVSTEACIGVVMYKDGDGLESYSPEEQCSELVKRADIALHRAKQDGSGSCHIYSAVIDERIKNRVALRHSLHSGLVHEQFQLHYQPLVDLSTGEIVGAEALVRWNHPDLGLQRPDSFIPYAESSGLIVPLGAWVLKHAMRQAQSWRRQEFVTPRISINVSGTQLQRPGFMTMVERTLNETGAMPCDFELELTEGTLISAERNIREQLDSLRKLGFSLAIDDFGTGHSTLKYLRDLPVSKIKIDQTFVRQLVIDSNDACIIRAIITLARSLQLGIVAEGIETVMQHKFLLEEGCRIGQGYLMSMPLAADDFGWLLESNRRLLPTHTSESQHGARDGSVARRDL